jgi:hypothetical protein
MPQTQLGFAGLAATLAPPVEGVRHDPGSRSQRPRATALTLTLTRRRFLDRGVRQLTAASLVAGLPRGWVGALYASDAP